MSNELATRPVVDLSVIDYTPVSPENLRRQVNAIQEAMKGVMKEGTHYGAIPGCGDKPTLLKPGAEKISLMFRLVPEFEIDERQMDNGHREYRVYCRMLSSSGQSVGMGVGSCSTMETKYRWRKAERACPTCGQPALIKSTNFKTKEPDGWLCYGKKGGCGARFPLGSEAIEGQQVGRIENLDIADTYNTVLKMGKKRAHVDAVLTVTAASDIFTQDIEDMADNAAMSPMPITPKPAPRPDTLQVVRPVAPMSEASPTLPEPSETPWTHKIEGGTKGRSQGKYLFELASSTIETMLKPAFRSRITDADFVNAQAALACPDDRQFAAHVLELQRIKAAEARGEVLPLEEDEIPNFGEGSSDV